MKSVLEFLGSPIFWIILTATINIVLLIIIFRLLKKSQIDWSLVSPELDYEPQELHSQKSDQEEIHNRLRALIDVTQDLSYRIEKLDNQFTDERRKKSALQDKEEMFERALKNIEASYIDNLKMLREEVLEYSTKSIDGEDGEIDDMEFEEVDYSEIPDPTTPIKVMEYKSSFEDSAPPDDVEFEEIDRSIRPDPAPPIEMETEEIHEDDSGWGGSVPPDDFEFEELYEELDYGEDGEIGEEGDEEFGYEDEGVEEFSEEDIGIPAMQTVISDSVNFAGFSPSSMQPDSIQIIDIWAFTEPQFDAVKEIAKELDRDKITGYKSGLKIDRGTVISIHLSSLSKTIQVENSTEAITWEGEKTNASFAISIDSNAKIGKHILKASISVHGLSIATLLLNVEVSESGSDDQQQCDGSFEKVNSAFASYASENRAQVLARIQGIKKVQPDMEIFLDVLSLRSGDNWANKLSEHVPSKDKFYLFWSKPASESVWVEREWKLALEKRGLSYIDPVPLDEPSDAPPPSELSSLHFNDAYMTYAKYYESK